MARAEKSASRLCFSTYSRHSAGTGVIPSGSAAERRRGVWRTEYGLQGVARKTVSNSAARMRWRSGGPTPGRN
eukprot:6493455-Prymnesium_polylepis.1